VFDSNFIVRMPYDDHIDGIITIILPLSFLCTWCVMPSCY